MYSLSVNFMCQISVSSRSFIAHILFLAPTQESVSPARLLSGRFAMFYYTIDAQLFLHPQHILRNKHCPNYKNSLFTKSVYLTRNTQIW